MDYLLTRGLEMFGRTVTYSRAGYTSFNLTGILDIEPRLESVDLGKYFAVTLRLKDFENATFAASVRVQFDGTPGTNNTVTFDGVTYTFQNVLTATPREVLKSPQAVDCATALRHAINATAGQEGVWYSTGTTAHPTCIATQDGQDVIVSYRTSGIVGNNKSASETLYNASLSAKLFSGGGPIKSDEVTIDGLTYKVGDVGYDAEGGVTLRLHEKTA